MRLPALLCVAVLSACGGGGDAPAPPVVNASPGGIWEGVVDSSATAPINVSGVIAENGDGIFIEDNLQAIYALTATVSGGSNLTAPYTGYAAQGFVFPNGLTKTTGTITATIQGRQSIVGTYSGQSETGTVNVVFDGATYNRDSSLALMVGTWRTVLDGVQITIAIQGNGSYTGTSTDGCSYSGSVFIINPQFNAYGVDNVATCPSFTTVTSGLAVHFPATSTQNASFIVGLRDADTAFAGVFVRQ